MPEVVNVLGRVYNPTGVVFNPRPRRWGTTSEVAAHEDADRDHIFVVQADGSVLTKDTTARVLDNG